MASAAEQLAANINFAAFAKATELQKRIWFTLIALDRLPHRHLHPDPGRRSGRFRTRLPRPGRRHSRHVQHVLRRRRQAHGDLRAERDALHLGLDHHSADVDVDPVAGALEEGRRSRPQAAQPIHALSHAACWRWSSPTASPIGLQASQGVVTRSGHLLRRLDRDHADRRHDVPDVAGRADHRARRRQRHVAHHLRRHRRRHAAHHHADACRSARTGDVNPFGVAVDRRA